MANADGGAGAGGEEEKLANVYFTYSSLEDAYAATGAANGGGGAKAGGAAGGLGKRPGSAAKRPGAGAPGKVSAMNHLALLSQPWRSVIGHV